MWVLAITLADILSPVTAPAASLLVIMEPSCICAEVTVEVLW
jgi:hypothetical protein